MYRPDSFWTWSFVAVTTIQAIIVLALESLVFALFIQSLRPENSENPAYASDTRSIPTSLTQYIFAMLYELVLVWDALRMKNTIQVIGLCLCNFGLMIYGAVQVEQIHQSIGNLNLEANDSNLWLEIRPPLVTIPCILAAGLVLMSVIAWKLYDEFAWTIYKHISADLQMKRRYLNYQIYIALLKFDFLFFLGFTIQFVVVVVSTRDAEFWLTVAAIPITICILLAAAFFTRRESKPGMAIIIILYLAGLVYFLYKLVRIYNGPPEKKKSYGVVAKPLTTFAVITIILLVATISVAIRCMMNFDKGLKPHIMNRKVQSEEEKAYSTEMPNLSHGAPVPSRMTIE